MKFFVFILLLATGAHAQDFKKLNPFIIKSGDCINGVKPGYTCYSESDTKVLDGNQNDLLKCQAELLKSKPVTVKKIYDCPSIPAAAPVAKSNHMWLKIGLGVLLGFGAGIGVGLSQ